MLRYSRRSYPLAFCISLLFFLSAHALRAQESVRQIYRPTLIIDSQALHEDARAAIVLSLGNVKKPVDWETVTLNPGDSLSKIVFENYGYSTSNFPSTTAALTKLIIEANQVQSTKGLIAGQQLLIPMLPRRPFAKGAKTDLAQVWDTANDSVFLARSKNVMTLSNEATSVGISEDLSIPAPLASGGTWVVKMSAQETEQFLDGLSDKFRRDIVGGDVYIGPTVEVGEVSVPELPDLSSPSPGPMDAHQATLNFVVALEPKDVGKYYILDFFKPNGSQQCTHGDMVVDVAAQALGEYGAGKLRVNLIPIQIDFFEDKDKASEIIRDYIKTFSSEKVQKNLNSALITLRSQNKPTPDKKYVPLLFLQALYSNLVSKPDTAVISSSFFLRFDGYRVVPLDYRPDSAVVLLSAVMDDGGSIEDALVEPQQSFYQSRRDLGVVLVGAEKQPGIAFGMTSKDGDGVSCLGKGAGWGTAGACITPQKIGTSFSTPSVAIQVLLATAFWHANNLNLTAKEAKTRLLLSSDLTPAYVGQYASGGIPRLEKILRLNGAFGEMTDGRIVDVSLVSGFIEVRSLTGGEPDRFNFKRGNEGFCGIQIVGGRTFIFREALMQWKEVEPTNFSVTIRENGIDKPLSLDTFTTQFKEIVLL